MHARRLACAVSAVALFSVVGPAAAAHAATAGPCDAKLLAYFKAADAVQTAQTSLTAAQQAYDSATGTEKILRSADAAIREGVLSLPWAKGSLQVQQNLGQAVRAYKALYIKAVDDGPDASAGNPAVAAQTMVGAAQKLVTEAKMSSDQNTMLTMKRVNEGVSDMKAAYQLFLTVPARKAELAQAAAQADSVESSLPMARAGLESCLQQSTAGRS